MKKFVSTEMELREDGDDDVIWTSSSHKKVIFRFVFSKDSRF